MASSSPDSNRGALRVEPRPGRELPLYLDGEIPLEAVSRVRRALAADFDGALDVVVLGMGADGHVASLFPGRPPLPELAALVTDSPKTPAQRITLTRAMLATAQRTILVAAGAEKRTALTGLASGDASLPATGLPGLVVCTDQRAEAER